MTTNFFARVCDNFDHEGIHANVRAVLLREEYGGGLANWCDTCCERDAEMLVPECSHCGQLLREDDKEAMESGVCSFCSFCLEPERQGV